MAEIVTGKTWRQLYDEQLRLPLGWGVLSTYGGAANPNPAGALACTGVEYVWFLMMQLRQGLDGNNRLLTAASIQQQRADAFGPTTTIAYSAYTFLGKRYHYGFGNWLETANGQDPSAGNPVNRWSSTGKFGWAPWIVADGSYVELARSRGRLARPWAEAWSRRITRGEESDQRTAMISRRSCSARAVGRPAEEKIHPNRYSAPF